jgi:hypothetical protein
MRRFAVVSTILLLMSPMLSARAALPQDDAGSGGDAPDRPTAEFRIDPGVVYSGTVEGKALGDAADWYAFAAPANAALEARVGSAGGCISLHDPTGAELDSVCTLAFANLGGAAAKSGPAGVYFVRFWFNQPTINDGPPQAYRFSVGVNEEAPAPSPAPGAGGVFPRNHAGLPKVSPGSASDKHVVVAVIDTGVNVYHDFFRASRLTKHPGAWLPGFPRSAKTVHLALTEPTYAKALERDSADWAQVKRSTYDDSTDTFDATLYTFPGTRVVGGISFGEFVDPTVPAGIALPIHDGYGHGTHSAGLAAGANLPAADGNVLIVAVEVGQGTFQDGLRWAARQPWIDAITISLGGRANAPLTFSPTGDKGGAEWATLEAFRSGKPVFVASGNGVSGLAQAPDRCTTYTGEYTGPAWVTRVGAATPDNKNPTWWHCVPVDATARTDVPSPVRDEMSGASIAGGTSAATPNAAGSYAHLLLAGRRAGSKASRLATLEHLLRSAAPPPPATGASSPSAYPVSLADQGYGVVDEAALRDATARLVGRKGPAPRPETELWFENDAALRLALWGPGSATDSAVPLQDDAGTARDAPDTRSSRVRIEPGVRYAGRLMAALDGDRSDWYAFDAAAGDTISLDAAVVDACYEIVEPAGQVAASACAANGGVISTTATGRGRWFVHVSASQVMQPYSFGVGLNSAPPSATRLPRQRS